MIVLAVLVLVFVLLALLPVGVRVRYDDGQVLLQLAAGWIRMTLYPPKSRKKRKATRRKKKRDGQQNAQPKQTGDQEKLSMEQLRPLLTFALKVVKELPQKLLVRNLTLHAVCGGGDAAEAAIGYGRAWAVIGGVMPVLENTFRIQNRDVRAFLDYEQKEIRLLLDLDIRMRLGTLLLVSIKAGVHAIRKMMQNKKKAVQENESSSL